MDNGDQAAVLLQRMQNGLRGLEPAAYYAQPIPARADKLLPELFARFGTLTRVQQERFFAGLGPAERALCGLFGHRAATQAVREGDVAALRRGLLGAVAANLETPPRRDVEVGLAVFHHCARKLQQDPRQLFAEAAAVAREPFAGQLLAFGRRQDVVLSRFGWIERQTEAGVQFKFEFG